MPLNGLWRSGGGTGGKICCGGQYVERVFSGCASVGESVEMRYTKLVVRNDELDSPASGESCENAAHMNETSRGRRWIDNVKNQSRGFSTPDPKGPLRI